MKQSDAETPITSDQQRRDSDVTQTRHENLVTVETQREFDLFTGEWADRVFVKLYVAARTSGLLSAISDRNWKTLCTLATYMDADGYCYPSQQELAAAMGCSRQMANERIKSLAEFRFEGQPVLIIVKEKRGKAGKWSRNGYQVMSLSKLRIYDDPPGTTSAQHGNDSSSDTSPDDANTVSRKLDTDPRSRHTVSSHTGTVGLDTNKKHSLELKPNISFEIRKTDTQRDKFKSNSDPESVGTLVERRFQVPKEKIDERRTGRRH